MSELDSRFVKRGYWINQSHGQVMGKTITTDTKTGTIIIALLAIGTSLASSHLWNLLTFLYHQSRANGSASSGLFRQQQALLRTLPTPSSLVADSIKLMFNWRKTKTSNSTRLLLPQTAVGILFTLGTLAASIFSSLAVKSSNLDVLVDSPFCGPLLNTEGHESISEVYTGQVHATSQRYVQECYQNATDLPARCDNIFVRPNIRSSMETVPCPFSPEMCSSPALAFDSKLIDVNDAFGFNLGENDRVKYRKRTTCSILSLENRTRTLRLGNDEFPLHLFGRPLQPQEEILVYYFGKREDVPEWENATYVISWLEANVTKTLEVYGPTWYTGGDAVVGSQPYYPLPEMTREDADVILIRIKKLATLFITPVDDLMFAAHRPRTGKDIGSGETFTFYLSDEPQTLVGCTEQYQFCVKNSATDEFCSELSGLFKALSPENRSKGNKLQQEVLRLLYKVSKVFNAEEVRSLNATSLLGSYGVIPSLPEDHWKSEFRHISSIVWADHQIALTDYAIGPSVRDYDPEWEWKYPPPTKEGKELCQMIKMRKPGGFVNINVFALAFIITFAALVTLLDLILLRFLIYLSKFRKALSPQIDRWIQDSVFQLQRRAYEAEGQGTWSELDKEIPIVTDGHHFPDLAVQTLPSSVVCHKCSHTSYAKEDKGEKGGFSGGSPTIVQTEDLFGSIATLPAQHEKSQLAISKSGAAEDSDYWDEAHLSRSSTAVPLAKSASVPQSPV